MKDNEMLLRNIFFDTTLSNNQIYKRLYQEILKLNLELDSRFFDICRNLYSPKRCIEIINFIKEKGYLPIQYKMWLTND